MPVPAGSPTGASRRAVRFHPRPFRFLALALLLASISGCRGALIRHYEYEEEMYLSLDGSATVYINASVPALVALRGVELDLNPRARLDRRKARALFQGGAVRVTRVSTSRRDNRRFVHVRLDVSDVRHLGEVNMLAWSSYRMAEDGDLYVFRQVVGPSENREVGNVGWKGDELVAFRVHLPSKIAYHNARTSQGQPADVARGNILAWEQPLADRRAGKPVDIEVRMETESILFRTLVLFGTMIALVAVTFGAVIWWVARRGKEAEV